ncbi:Hypp4240 [Branchiostoma lanceolatum]|uniref:Hypp4240 protein n=1 Tax=Branchiostoma lanceolatum TaxID=7740 RepID=A0A8K0A5M2_BRALA|nr:Hypp4240 [Branchiostoma lanceolatum]
MADSELTSEAEDMSDSEYMTCDEGNRDSMDQQGRTQAPTTAQDQARPESPSLAQDLATAQCTAASAVSDQGAPTGDGIEDTTPLENILDNEDLLSKIAVMLDQDSNSRKNWKAIATKYGIGYNERKNIEYVNCQNGRCTEVVLGKVVSSNPDITVRDFLVKLEEIGRNDVIDVVKKFYHE